MLIKAGSKLYIAGEYAILDNDSFALISFIENILMLKYQNLINCKLLLL